MNGARNETREKEPREQHRIQPSLFTPFILGAVHSWRRSPCLTVSHRVSECLVALSLVPVQLFSHVPEPVFPFPFQLLAGGVVGQS